MAVTLDAQTLDLAEIIRPGDMITLPEMAGEPTVLVEALLAQAERLGGVRAYIGVVASDRLPNYAGDAIRFASYGALSLAPPLFERGLLDVVPGHYSEIPGLVEHGTLKSDVAFVSVTPPDADGNHSLGPYVGHMRAAMRAARTVVAEVNDRLPWTFGEAVVPAESLDYLVPVSRPVVELPPRAPGAVEIAIAENVARLVADRSVVQTGIGSLPDAILRQLTGKRDLGFHSGLMSEAMMDLVEAGAITNRYKSIDPGVCIASGCLGTKRLYDWLDRNQSVYMQVSDYTHNAAVLAEIDNLVAINSAVEIDITGQINAEAVGSRYIGATGGQGDFQRAAVRSPTGRAVIALPSVAGRARKSRIVARLSGPVTTPRSDADVIITEHGIAELHGRTLAERARAMIAIADPEHRPALERAAGEGLF